MRPFGEWLTKVAQFTGVSPGRTKSAEIDASDKAIDDNGPFDKYQDGAEKQTGDQYRIPGERHGR